MKKKILLIALLLMFLVVNVFSQTVYITNTGTKYHKDGCKYLSKSKIEVTLSKALEEGYGACSVCKPPTEVTNKSNQTQAETTKKETTTVSTTTKPKTSQSVSVQCSATTKAGTRCKRMTKSPNGKCYQHGGN